MYFCLINILRKSEKKATPSKRKASVLKNQPKINIFFEEKKQIWDSVMRILILVREIRHIFNEKWLFEWSFLGASSAILEKGIAKQGYQLNRAKLVLNSSSQKFWVWAAIMAKKKFQILTVGGLTGTQKNFRELLETFGHADLK